MNYPKYNDLDITKYETLFGFYILGFIKHHRPDFYIIDIRLKNKSWDVTHDLANYDWLDEQIKQGLSENKKVVIIPEDEHVVFLPNDQLSEILNQYIDQPVYWVTMLDHYSQIVYKENHKFQIKILEVPWMMLNECLTYYPVANTVTEFDSTHYNYICLLGNTLTNYPNNHKIALAQELHRQGLSGMGLITISKQHPHPVELLEYCKINSKDIYSSNLDPNYPPYARQSSLNGVWISKNVDNYLYIDKLYHSTPLVISPETTVAPFKSTEKSIWPILLGKLFLIYGRPKSIDWIQRFYDIDISKFANVEYDDIKNDQDRLTKMISCNKVLIENAKEIQIQFSQELESARWTLGKNLYQFTINQLDKII